MVLGVDPQSDLETIQHAHSKLAQKFGVEVETWDDEKLEAVNLALEVLSDPLLRREFDKLTGIRPEENLAKFSGLEFFEVLGDEAGLRLALLAVLYDRRRTRLTKPSLSVRQIENMMEATPERLTFALWYLKQRNLAVNDDKSSLMITVDGIDFLETAKASPEDVLPHLKPSAIAAVTEGE